MLHPVPQLPGPHLYCGPTAACAVTGLHQYDVVGAVWRLRGNQRPVVSMYDYELCAVLAMLGWAAEHWEVLDQPTTLHRFVTRGWRWRHPCIVGLSQHYVSTDGAELLCNITKGLPVPMLGSYPNKTKRVLSIMEVRRMRPLSRRSADHTKRVDRPTLSPA